MIAGQSRNLRIVIILLCVAAIAAYYRLYPRRYQFSTSQYGLGTPEEIAKADALYESEEEAPEPIRVTQVIQLVKPTKYSEPKEPEYHIPTASVTSSPKPATNSLGAVGAHLPHATHYPKRFPRKIWQFWKGPFDTLSDDDHREIQTWRELNPEYRWELIVNGGAEITYIQDRYADRPDIVDTFISVRDFINRVDLLRYLVLYSEGGTYADIDTRCLRPISKWIGPAWEDREVNLVLGIEIDSPDGPKWKEWADTFQFASWSIMAKPGHPVLERTITRVSENLRKMNEASDGVKLSGNNVLTLGGPAAFTKAALEAMSEMTGTNVTYKNMTGLTEPKLIGDVLILPITGFGPDQSHSNSKPSTDEAALVKHLFKGSWKGAHPWEENKNEADEERLAAEAEEDEERLAAEVEEDEEVDYEDEEPKYKLNATSRRK